LATGHTLDPSASPSSCSLAAGDWDSTLTAPRRFLCGRGAEAMPFVSLLVVFFGVVTVIQVLDGL
jgi:hypothetical protein